MNYLDTINAFVREQLYPLEPLLLQDGFEAVAPRLEALRQEVKALGLWAPHLPPDFGGMDLPLREFAQVSEALGRSPLGHYTFNCAAPDIGNMELLHAHGTRSAAGTLAAPAGRRRDPQLLRHDRARARRLQPRVDEHHGASRDGDEYVIDGHKWFTTAADGAAFAVVMAVTDAEHPKAHRRASQIIVPLETPGYTLVRNISIMGERGSGWLSHGEVRFDGLPRAGDQPHRRRGGRLCPGAGAAGAGAHPPLHALDRHLRARLRPHVPLCRRPRAGAGPAHRRPAGGAALDRRQPRRHRRRAAARARRRGQDRQRWAHRRRASRSPRSSSSWPTSCSACSTAPSRCMAGWA